MGFRYRKSVRLMPGVRLNLSKRGPGLSFGVRGLRYSVNSRGQTRRTVGLPGTGLSYTTTSHLGDAEASGVPPGPQQPAPKASAGRVLLVALALVVIVGALVTTCSSDLAKPAALAVASPTPSPETWDVPTADGQVTALAFPPPVAPARTSPRAVRRTASPRPRVVVGAQPVAATDPRFGTCREAKAHGYGPYYAGKDPEYSWYHDRDHDGIVCE